MLPFAWLGDIMTHQGLGVPLGLLFELPLLLVLEPAGGGSKESAGDAGSHCVGGLLRK